MICHHLKPNQYITACFAFFAIGFGLVAVADETVPRMLMVTQSAGFRHKPVRRNKQEYCTAELAMREIADRSKAFVVECTQDAAVDFTQQNLKKFDLVCFYTSGDLPISDGDLNYFITEWLPQPKHGFLGFHSATDTYKGKDVYCKMIGGTFDGHPWGQNSRVTISVHDMEHPAMKPFGGEFEFRDEIYQYRNWKPDNVQVLMSLNMEKSPKKRPYHVPVAWAKQIGKGRIFYTNLGHRDETWHEPRFKESIVGAVTWLVSDTHPVKPNPKVSAQQHQLSIEHSTAAGITVQTLQRAKERRKKRADSRRANQAARAEARRPSSNQQ